MEKYLKYLTLFKASHYDPEVDHFTEDEFSLLDENLQDLIISQHLKYLAYLTGECC